MEVAWFPKYVEIKKSTHYNKFTDAWSVGIWKRTEHSSRKHTAKNLHRRKRTIIHINVNITIRTKITTPGVKFLFQLFIQKIIESQKVISENVSYICILSEWNPSAFKESDGHYQEPSHGN